MTAKATFIKSKTPYTRSVWIVSKYNNPRDIMKFDYKTMKRLQDELLTPKAKERTVIVNSIETIKQIGVTTDVKETQR